nr:entry exclusion lipoprotein TrbK [Variovorax boronicumulans]
MKHAVLLCLAVVILGGCDSKPPAATAREVNDRNCQIEEIKNIEDKAMRETFAVLPPTRI